MLGEHLIFTRLGYTHHAVAIDDERVLQFEGVGPGARKTGVRIARTEDVRGGSKMFVKQYARRFPPEEVVHRAMSLLGREGYNILDANCEHLATWCMTGEWKSEQARAVTANLLSAVGAPVAATVVKELIAAAGTGDGAARVMSGLKTVALGTHPLVGVGLAAVAPAAVVVAAIATTIPHDANLSDAENLRRRKVRRGAVIGAIAGAVAGTLLVVAVGGGFGKGAAGLSRGLRAVGGTMNKGLGVVGAIGGFGAIGGALLTHAAAR